MNSFGFSGRTPGALVSSARTSCSTSITLCSVPRASFLKGERLRLYLCRPSPLHNPANRFRVAEHAAVECAPSIPQRLQINCRESYSYDKRVVKRNYERRSTSPPRLGSSSSSSQSSYEDVSARILREIRLLEQKGYEAVSSVVDRHRKAITPREIVK